MKAYKGFNQDMTCRGFQYEEGKTYETDKAVLCETGFHACEMPLNVFHYYPPASAGRMNKFHEVELEDVCEKGESVIDDTKVCAKKIRIGAELDIAALVKAQIAYVKEHCDEGKGMTAGDRGAATAGNCGAATSRGISSVGENGIACARGNGCKVKGGMGAVLVIAEENEDNCDIKSWESFVIDGEKYMPDTWYTLKNDDLVEVDE